MFGKFFLFVGMGDLFSFLSFFREVVLVVFCRRGFVRILVNIIFFKYCYIGDSFVVLVGVRFRRAGLEEI